MRPLVESEPAHPAKGDAPRGPDAAGGAAHPAGVEDHVGDDEQPHPHPVIRLPLKRRDRRELERQTDHGERPPPKTNLGQRTKASSNRQPGEAACRDRPRDEQHPYRLRARPRRSEAEILHEPVG